MPVDLWVISKATFFTTRRFIIEKQYPSLILSHLDSRIRNLLKLKISALSFAGLKVKIYSSFSTCFLNNEFSRYWKIPYLLAWDYITFNHIRPACLCINTHSRQMTIFFSGMKTYFFLLVPRRNKIWHGIHPIRHHNWQTFIINSDGLGLCYFTLKSLDI